MSESNERKAIFITGAASGMGRATAELFASKGWLVGALDVDVEGLRTLEKELGSDRCWIRYLDVTDKAEYDAAVSEFGAASGGRLDLLFNNAGIGEGGFFEDVPHEAAMRVVHVNLIGVLNGIYAALPLLKATEGSLCFSTSSSSATYGMPNLAVYSATKHAVKGLTEALSIEFERHGIRVADVLPGLIDTPILTRTPDRSGLRPEGFRPQDSAPQEGPFRLMPASSVAECVWEAYRSDRLHWYVPEEIGAIDRAKAAGAEAVRDQIRSFTLATPAQGEG
ncbi:MAG: SDR family oxidoreductase [Myxococcota bacterium]